MSSLKWYFFLVFLSLLAFLLYVYSVAGALENPNDPSDTVGVPAAYIFSSFIMGLGAISWGLSLIGLLACKVVSIEHSRTKLFISSLANFPLLLTCVLGVFSVAAFSYDSIVGVLSGVLFFLVVILLCVGLIRVVKPSRSSI
ncbi:MULTISPECIES: hypothetical protein [Pseudomonas]|uniref:hypothetical protein n=1 Tax=Pseudomonas TaxID=286 RepID=UPI001C0A7F49|nr:MULTISPECIES: hypothetical protein [Pseudomonas]MCK3839934.1 hypothetical protein [Pseudomonas sp. NCIMB 10586]VCU63545.1 hypothetical protein [Pseudomonas synxantha]